MNLLGVFLVIHHSMLLFMMHQAGYDSVLASSVSVLLTHTDCQHEASVPVQMKGSDLRIVPLKVREVEEVYIRLRISGLSAHARTHAHTQKKNIKSNV